MSMKNRLTILAFVFMLAVFALFIALPGDEASVLKENRSISTRAKKY